MRIEFNDLKGKEESTLFIIGNGFDLYHDVKSKYKHFCCWLNLNDHEDFVEDIEHIFPKLDGNQISLWSNFEEVLQSYNLDDLYSTLHTENHDHWEPETWRKTAQKMEITTRQMRPLMREWAKQIEINNVNPNLELSKKSLYLTFNYTNLLEETYQIPSDRICHIHGSVDDDEVIVGHVRWQKPEDYNAQSDEKEIVCREFLKVLNKLNKGTDEQIGKHETFFNLLKNVTHVVVLGHSMGDIDRVYFREVLNRVQKGCHWHFGKHSTNDDLMIHKFINATQESCRNNKIELSNCWIFNY